MFSAEQLLDRILEDSEKLTEEWEALTEERQRELLLDMLHLIGEQGKLEIQWAEGYAECGYAQPERGVLLANWNQPILAWIGDRAEKLGYKNEWSDEWTLCDGCQKAVRTSPDSYGWMPSFIMWPDGEIDCRECADAETVINFCDARPTYPLPEWINPADYDWENCPAGINQGDLVVGWDGWDDFNPEKIVEKFREDGIKHVIFQKTDSRQFGSSWRVWVKGDEDWAFFRKLVNKKVEV